MRFLLTIVLSLGFSLAWCQALEIPANATLEIGPGASIETPGSIGNDGTISNLGSVTLEGDLLINAGTFHIGETGNLTVFGDLENSSNLENLGTMSLRGDWLVNNLYNGLDGNLEFAGSVNQTISPPSIQTAELTMNSNGIVSFTGTDLTVFERIEFQNGVMITADPTQVLLMGSVIVSGGNPDSYFQGKLSYRNGGDRFFPVGYQGQYAPITLTEVAGTQDTEHTVFYQNPNPDVPRPGMDLLGVSHLGIWEVELTGGTVSQAAPYTIEFSNENLRDFQITNDIRHIFNSPVIAYTPSPDSLYTSLGVESLTNTDSVSFGLITSETGVMPQLQEPFYLALGLAPRIDPNGLYYIPEIFSPAATDATNKTFRIFGELISEENFRLEIYNKFGGIVYTSDSFIEANEQGWDGINQKTKSKEPTGTYYYYLTLQKENGQVFTEKGALFLLR